MDRRGILDTLFPPERGRWRRWLGNERGEWGSANQTKTPKIPPPSPQEAALQAQNAQTAALQAAQMQAYNDQLNAYTASPLYTQGTQLAQQGQANMLARDQGGAYLSPSEQAYLDQAFASSSTMLRNAWNDAAAARGMSIGDTPVQTGYLQGVADLASSKAAAGLQLGQQDYANWQNAATFGQTLAQQNLGNRLNFASTAPAGYGLQTNLNQLRINSAPINQSGSSTGLNFGSIGQGIGGLGSALGAYDRWKNPRDAWGRPINQAQTPPSSPTGNPDQYSGPPVPTNYSTDTSAVDTGFFT